MRKARSRCGVISQQFPNSNGSKDPCLASGQGGQYDEKKRGKQKPKKNDALFLRAVAPLAVGILGVNRSLSISNGDAKFAIAAKFCELAKREFGRPRISGQFNRLATTLNSSITQNQRFKIQFNSKKAGI